MTRTPSPHDLILHLRTHCPGLARRLDGVRGVGRTGDVLVVRAPAGSWSLGELTREAEGLEREARRVLGPGVTVRLEASPPDPEALPFPATASKVWNHLAFWAWTGAQAAFAAVPKPRYAESWLPLGGAAGPAQVLQEAEQDPRTRLLIYDAPAELPAGEDGPSWTLPAALDDLAALARDCGSYVHLVTPFPGDLEAARLEGRLLAVKEWGTPATPGPVLQKYVGRLHYVAADAPPLGVRVARLALGAAR